jgi:hypothetical protein
MAKKKKDQPETNGKLSRKTFEAELYKLHAELCRLPHFGCLSGE